jgi:hypothetical protein
MTLHPSIPLSPTDLLVLALPHCKGGQLGSLRTGTTTIPRIDISSPLMIKSRVSVFAARPRDVPHAHAQLTIQPLRPTRLASNLPLLLHDQPFPLHSQAPPLVMSQRSRAKTRRPSKPRRRVVG